MIQLCTLELVTMMQEVDESHPMDLEEKDQDIDYASDDIREVNYIDTIFGDQSKMTYGEWRDTCHQKAEIREIFYKP